MMFIISYTTTIWNIQIEVDTNFFCGKFSPFCNKYFKYIFFLTNSSIFKKIEKKPQNFQKMQQKSQLLPIIWNFV